MNDCIEGISHRAWYDSGMPLDARDRELLEQISSPEQREIVERSLAHHRQEDRLGPGDPVPDLELIGL